MRALLLAAALLLCSAHSWYDYACCSDKDCFELPDGSVRVTKTGYYVTLSVNGHPLQLHIAQSEAKPSQDEHYHICLMPTYGEAAEQPFTARCFYAPPLGV